MCENVGPLAQYSHSDSYIYLLTLIAMLVIFALSTFQLGAGGGTNAAMKLDTLSSRRYDVTWLSLQCLLSSSA